MLGSIRALQNSSIECLSCQILEGIGACNTDQNLRCTNTTISVAFEFVAHAVVCTTNVVAEWFTTGVGYVFDDCDSAITIISFANLRNDLLAFASQSGDVWIVHLTPGSENDKAHAAQGDAKACESTLPKQVQQPVVTKVCVFRAK